jgi:hypothetical protein
MDVLLVQCQTLKAVIEDGYQLKAKQRLNPRQQSPGRNEAY